MREEGRGGGRGGEGRPPPGSPNGDSPTFFPRFDLTRLEAGERKKQKLCAKKKKGGGGGDPPTVEHQQP